MNRDRWKVRSVVIYLGVLYASALLSAQTRVTTTVLITVTEPTGMGVADAHVRVVPAPDPLPAKTDTDSKGRLALDLRPGGYALFVSCPGFANVATHVDIRDSGTQTIPIALKIASYGGPVTVYPPSEKDSLLISLGPYHDDVRLKPAEFKALPHTTITIHNSHSNVDETYSGVPLAELLARFSAPLGKELHGIALTHYVVAAGSDGYEAVLSLAEVDPSFHPGDVIVADSMNGKPLDAKSGPFKLVVSEDKRPARSVHNLISLQLKSPD
jgi:hypothetical protein